MSVIGFVGLGNMGEPMAARLADAGHAVLAYDTSAEARDRLSAVVGVTVTQAVSDVAADADAVILMLPDSRAVEQVLLDDGLLAHLGPNTLLVDMSSSDPMSTRSLAGRAAAQGVTLIDAPVSGGVSGARSGSLTIMVGGPRAALEEICPVLNALGAKVMHAGEAPGTAHAVKALNNLMSATHLLSSSEAILAGRGFGLDAAVILDIVNGSSGRSGSTEAKWPKFILPMSFDSGFSLRLMLKDMRTALELAHASGTPTTLSQAAVDAWGAAAEALPAAADHTEIARWLEGQLLAGHEKEHDHGADAATAGDQG